MKPSKHSTTLTMAQLAAGMILFGSATPVSKIVTDAMPVFVGAGLRVLIGALALAPFVWPHRGQFSRIGRADWLKIGAIALFGMFGFTVFMLIGMKMITGVAGSIIMSMTPALTAMAAIIFLGEHVTWRKVVAVGLAAIGVTLLHLGGGAGGSSAGGAGGEADDPVSAFIMSLGTSAVLGSVLVFLAICCEATYTLVGRAVGQHIDPMLVAFLGAALSLPLFVPLAAIQWGSFTPAEVSAAQWSAVIWYGAGTLALGTAFWYVGISRAQGSVAAGFMGLMPVSALVLSYVLLGEEFRLMHLVGFVIVFAGVLLIAQEHARMAEDD